MKKLLISMFTVSSLWCGGSALANVTETTDLGPNSQYASYASHVVYDGRWDGAGTFADELYLEFYTQSWQDTWHDVLVHMAIVERDPSVNNISTGYSTHARANRYRALDYAVYGGSTVGYNRFVNNVAVDLSSTNGLVGASLEWTATLDDGEHPNSISICPNGPTLLEMVVWPDYYPASDNFPRTRNYYVTQPHLKVTRQIADVQPQTNTDPLAEQGDPINSINGNVSIAETDLVTPTAGVPLEFRRWYGTVLDGDGSLGPRWRHSYLWSIGESNTVYNGSTNLWLVLQAGENWHWKALSVTNGGHEVADGDWRWDWRKTNNAYTVSRPGGISYAFDTNGVLTRIANAYSNGVSLTYTNLDGHQRLARVQHDDGRALVLTYDASNRLQTAAMSYTNLSMHYTYNGSGLLTNTTRIGATVTETTRYEWDGTHQTVTQRVNNIGEPRAWEYDGAMGTRSYVGTGRWYEVALDYSFRAQNKTQVMTYRGYTNTAFYQEFDPVRGKITSTSQKTLPEILQWANVSSVISNVVWYYTGDSWAVFTNNPLFVADVMPLCASNPIPQLGWSGTRYTRDDYGRIVTAETRDGTPGVTAWSKQSLSYDGQGRLTNSAYGYSVEPLNPWAIAWSTNWDMPASMTDPEGRRKEWDYANGLVSVERTFPATNAPVETRYAYTTNGLLTAVTNANGHWARYQYNNHGYPTQVFSEVGITNWMTWDNLGHLKEIRLPSTEYTTNEPPAMVPRVITLDPDELGRVRTITWPDGRSETFAFDGIGNVTNHVDAAGRTNRFVWLPTRKLASSTRFLAGASNQAVTVGMDYDQQMNVLKVSDELGRAVETYQLDLQDRPVKVTNVETQEMAVTYGLGDMVSKVVRFDQSSVSFSYDEGARLKTLVYPDATLNVSYLKNGLLRTASTSLGVISNAYDGANRLILAKGAGPTPQSSTVTYHLDPVGNPTNTQAAGLGYEVRRAFDAGERLSALAAGDVGATFAYNSVNGLLASMRYTNGIVCGYGYDELDRLTSMTWRDASNNVLRSRGYSYTLAGMISRVDMESGERVEYTYDSLDRLTSEKRTDPYGQTLADDRYEYDLTGNRTGKTILDATGNPLLTVNSTLGTGNKLASWSVAETNLVGQVDVAGVSSEAIGTNDRFGWLYVSNVNSGTSIKPYVFGTNFWTYDLTVGLGTQKVVAAIRDQAGNTTRVTNEVFLTVVTNGTYQYSVAGCVTNIAYKGKDYSHTLRLTWDSQYQLTAVATNGTVAERHGYDALGRRLWTWDAANGTNWMVCDGEQVVADVNSTGGLVRSYVWGPGIDNLLAMTVYSTTTNTYYALKDHLNSVLALVNAAGQIVEQYRYDAWGRTTIFDASGNPLSASAVGNRYGWQGREYSFKTGLYYFRARWYDPVTGRWLSNDPIGISGGLNQYMAFADNPVNFADPSGLDAGLTGSSDRFGHKGVQVHVRGLDGRVLGVLSADYHAEGFMGDGTQREGPLGTLAGSKGRVLLTFIPGDIWPKTLSTAKGDACDDDRLAQWILKTIGKDRTWLNTIVGKGKPYLDNINALAPFNVYSWPGSVCYDYANAAMSVYMTKPKGR